METGHSDIYQQCWRQLGVILREEELRGGDSGERRAERAAGRQLDWDMYSLLILYYTLQGRQALNQHLLDPLSVAGQPSRSESSSFIFLMHTNI